MSDAPKPKVVRIQRFSPFCEHRTMADVAMMARARLGEPWETLGPLFYPSANNPADLARKTFWKHATAEDAAMRSRSRAPRPIKKPAVDDDEDEVTPTEVINPWHGMGACFA